MMIKSKVGRVSSFAPASHPRSFGKTAVSAEDREAGPDQGYQPCERQQSTSKLSQCLLGVLVDG
jgi:hypothetical protein